MRQIQLTAVLIVVAGTVCADEIAFQPIATLAAENSSESYSIAFSPDGTLLAVPCWSSGANATDVSAIVRIWDVSSRSVVATLTQTELTSPLFSVAFAPDGKSLAIGYGASDGDQTTGLVDLWDVDSSNKTRTLRGHKDLINVIKFHPKGVLLSSVDFGGMVSIWDTKSGSLMRSFQGIADVATDIHFSPDGSLLAVVGGRNPKPGHFAIWNTEDGTKVYEIKDLSAQLHGVEWFPDGKTIAIASHWWVGETSIKLWDVNSRHFRPGFGSYSAFRLAVSQNGKLMASSIKPGVIQVWLVSEARGENNPINAGITSINHGGLQVNSLAFSPDGKILASGGIDGTVKLWDLRDIWIRSQKPIAK